MPSILTFSRSELIATIFAILALTRAPLAPKYLYYFDSVNFALALDEFNPAKHQPQPPGYPLFVALMRAVHLFVSRPEAVMVVAGLVMTTFAAALLWRLTTEISGRRATILAVALFLFNPACWLGGITNQVRTCLAFCSVLVALLCWRALHQPENRFAFYAVCGALGIGAGFRPALGVLLIPLVLWVWWRTGRSLTRLLAGAAISIAATAPWVIAAAFAVGGLQEWFALMWSYSNTQFRGTSALFGADATPARTMAMQAIVWNGLGVLSWIWAVPFLRGTGSLFREKGTIAFLLAWFAPIFLFSAFVHIGDPDQALASIPVLCLIGGTVLQSFLSAKRERWLVPVAVTAVSLNALVFFYPPGRLASASSYRAVAAIDHRTREVFEDIQDLKRGAAIAIIEYRGVVTWRHLTYYFPDDPVQFLSPDPSAPSWTVLHRKTVDVTNSGRRLPGPKRIILVTPFADDGQMYASGWKKHGSTYFRDLEPGAEIAVGPYRLVQPANL